MVRIRLRRVGAKKQPSYRVVVADSRSPRDGRFIENIGFYNPRTEPPTVEINGERALYWLSQGAQPSDAVARLLDKQGILPKPTQTEADADPAAEVVEVEAE
ncbi:MAG: 30S ribosomal protein S16 [Chloroflexota bacterium]|nr:30S ribosomal protein S16 [Chloroflexota bacterium]